MNPLDTFPTTFKEYVEWRKTATQEQLEAFAAASEAKAKAEQEAEQRRQKAEWQAEHMRDVPLRYRGARIENDEALQWVDDICADPYGEGLLIAGPTGVGKTHLLWGIYAELVQREIHMPVVKLVRLLSQLRPGGDSDDNTIDVLCNRRLLAIDDIGAHKPSEWVNERLYEIIDTRYDNKKPIVATTNRKNLDAVLDDRLSSRLTECCRLIVLSGPDRRVA